MVNNEIHTNTKRVLVVVPCYNEGLNIENVVESLIKLNYEYIIIDDGSTDNTETIINEKEYRHIRLDNNLGIGGCMQTGYKYALEKSYDIVVQFDGDGQHNASGINDLITPIISEDIDMVIGSRFIITTGGYQSTRIRKIGIRILSNTIRLLLGGACIKDPTSGFRAVNDKLIKIFAGNYPHEYPEPITNFWAVLMGFKVKEIPAIMNERKHGRTSISSFKSVYYMINVLIHFFALRFIKGE